MGYTTDFYGLFHITPKVKPEHMAYINQFSGTRRMKRNTDLTAQRPDPIRTAVGLPIGRDGGYFVGEGGMAGQGEGDTSKTCPDILEYNGPPSGQPGLWCQWVVEQPGNWHYRKWTDEEIARGDNIDKISGWKNNQHSEFVLDDADYSYLQWDGGEKFYEYKEWLEYLIDHFFKPWGYKVEGEVEWQGEDREDMGIMIVVDNVVTTKYGHISYEKEG